MGAGLLRGREGHGGARELARYLVLPMQHLQPQLICQLEHLRTGEEAVVQGVFAVEHLVELFGVGLKVGEGVGRGGRAAGLEGIEE